MRLFRRKDAAPPPHTKSASFLLTPGLGRHLAANATYQLLAKEGYAENCVAFACVNRIATAVAGVDIQLYRRTGSDLAAIESHPLLELLEAPNPAQSGDEFLQTLVSHRLTGGNAFVLGNGLDTGKKVTGLQLLNPAKVKVEPGTSIFPARYEYKPGNEAISYPVDQVNGRSAVLHLKTFNPLDHWVGMSPLLAAAYAVDIHNAGQQWNKRLLDNDARPSGAMVVKDGEGKPATLSEEQYRRLKDEIEAKYSGSGNAGRPMLLEGGLEWQQMSVSPKDMDFLNAKNAAATDIGLVYGVPPQLLGIPGANTFANYEQANLSFWTDTVIPLLKTILEGFNRWLVPLYGENLFLWYDENAIDALEPLRKAKADRVNANTSWSMNEKRRATGQDDVDGGDVILVPSTNIPLDMAGELTGLAEPGSAADPNADPQAAA